jgi:hypothetical protein
MRRVDPVSVISSNGKVANAACRNRSPQCISLPTNTSPLRNCTTSWEKAIEVPHEPEKILAKI